MGDISVSNNCVKPRLTGMKFKYDIFKSFLTAAILFLVATSSPLQAQLTFKGLMYLDYEYELTNPDEDVVGENGFNYRRWRLTGDYKISDTFSGRARLEASGTKIPFLKDLYLKWDNAIGENRDVYFGISAPPLWQVVEKYWGYRSLEATLLDKNKIASSRDFGVKSLGYITPDGTIRYGVMFANNESTSIENDKYKRVYGQIEFHPNENMAFTVEADYGPTELDSRTNLHAFAGYQNSSFHGGAEVFRYTQSPDDNSGDLTVSGVSLFGALEIAEKTEGILRADILTRDTDGVSSSTNFYLAGIAYQIEKGVTFIPNVLVTTTEGLDSAVTGRITLEAKF